MYDIAFVYYILVLNKGGPVGWRTWLQAFTIFLPTSMCQTLFAPCLTALGTVNQNRRGEGGGGVTDMD